MNRFANQFSLLQLDDDDNVEELISALSSSKKENGATKTDNCKHKSKSVDKDSSVEDSSQEGAALSKEYKLPLVWIDLEMTGLDVDTDRILEIACIITDGKLTRSIEGPDLVIRQSKECLDNMGDWCRTHHAASGLTEQVLKSTITELDAEKVVLDFIKQHIGSVTPLIAGNSIYTDLLFLKKYMPALAAVFSHVIVDVSSIMALCIRWFPKEKKAAPKKVNNHRAMDDIRESIAELKYYRDSIFKSTKSRR